MNKLFFKSMMVVGTLSLLFTSCNRNEPSGGKEEAKYCNITWANYDNKVLFIDSVQVGTTPTYNHQIPTRDSDSYYSYSFSGWSPEITTATKDATYVATYKETVLPPIKLVTPQKEIEIISRSRYDKIMTITNDSWRTDIYQEIAEALFEYETDNSDSIARKNGLKEDASQIAKNNAENKINNLKQEAEYISTISETTYEYEWGKVLEQYKVSSEEELKTILTRTFKKEIVVEWYVSTHYDELFDEYLSSYQPYHVAHSLVYLEDNGTDQYGNYSNTVISENEANKLYATASKLKDGYYTFYDVALTLSDDGGSAKEGGDVGIMTTLAPFYSEFKMGLYAFDGVYSGNVSETKANDSNIGFSTSSEVNTEYSIYKTLQDIGLRYVPYGVFHKIMESKSTSDGQEGTEHLLRNIYFNKYINRRNVFLITNNDFSNSSSIHSDITGDNFDYSEVDSSLNKADEGKAGFRYVPGVCKDENQMVLTDERSNPIICVRSESGVHFMVIEKSPFESDVTSYYDIENYSEHRSYINWKRSDDPSYYQERKSNILNEISNSISSPYFDYVVYQNLLENEKNIHFEYLDKSIEFEKEIGNAINTAINDNYLREYDSLFNGSYGWRSYLSWVKNQEEKRSNGILVAEPSL